MPAFPANFAHSRPDPTVHGTWSYGIRMNESVSRFDLLPAIPVAGPSGPSPVGWSIGRLSWPSSACLLFVSLRRRFAQHARPQIPARIENNQRVDAHLATFVATENVKRYRAILDSQPGDADRQVITALLVAEESRVQRLVRPSGNRSARGPAESRVRSRQWQVAS
jgi:hypothetical protein